MPKRSVYFKNEEDELYERVKQLTEESGETIGGVFVKAMKDYIAAKENEKSGMEKISVFDGYDDPSVGSQGEHIEFIGKLIGTGSTPDPQDGFIYYDKLYKTRKNKYVLVTSHNEHEVYVSNVKIIETIEELKKQTLPSSIMDALRNEKAAVRFLDI